MADGGGSFEFIRPQMPVPPPRDKLREAVRVVWEPLPGSQELVMSCPCNEILYHGTRGPGKTDAQLMKFRRYVGMGYGRHWRGVIFDREYKNLEDLISKSLRWFTQFGDGAIFLQSAGSLKWVWPTGEELLFRQVKKKQDYWKYHGQEFPFIGWNELSKYPTPELYDMMKSCNRSSFVPANNPIWLKGETKPRFLPEIPLIIMSTTNPYGAGHAWVKKRFIDAAEAGQVVWKRIEVFNPRTQQREEIIKTSVHIFGSYKENKYLAPEYVADLEAITNENLRRAWLWGDWNIVAGGALDDLWFEGLKVQRFKVPQGWRIDRSFDWGSSHPFSVGWWAEADGTEATLPSGAKWCPPKGTLVRISEWYGAEAEGTNKGVRLSAKTIAQGIKEHEKQLLQKGWIKTTPVPGPADNQIGNKNEADTETIRAKMEKEGVKWTESDKSPGSRKQGLQILRELMEASKTGEGPGIYFMTNCRAAIATLPVLPRDEDDMDDVDTDAEDHVYDDVRYRVLAKRKRAIVKNLTV